MKKYSIYEAKAKLSQVLKLVKSGQEVIITDRGTAVAKLSPVPKETDLIAKLKSMEEYGQLKRRVESDYGALPVNKSGVVERFLKERE